MLKKLVGVILYYISNVRKYDKCLNKVSYLKEQCTFQIRLPRNCGNSLLLSMVNKSLGKKSVLVLRKLNPSRSLGFDIVASTRSLGRVRSKEFKIVFIDDASYIGRKKIDEIYEICQQAEFFILVG